MYDKILANRALFIVRNKGFLDKFQFGGREKLGSTLQIIRVIEELNSILMHDDSTDKQRPLYNLVLFLADIAKAFDTSNRVLLIEKLIDLGISGVHCCFF